jgi:hypothetical protein
VSILKIIQTDIMDKEEQDRMKDTLRQVEKSPAGSETVLSATIDWLTYMDTKHPPRSDDEIIVASKLIDWAVGTTVCRQDLEANLEKLKTLKSESSAEIKTLRSGNSL